MYIGDSHSLVTSLLTEREPLLSPHLIPAASANVFLAMNLGDPVATWDGFMDSVRTIFGAEDYAQMQSDIAGFEQEVALSVRDDMLASLTGEIGIAMPFPDVGQFQMVEDGRIIFLGVKDSELCAMSIQKILFAGGRHSQPVDYGGATIYDMSLLNRSGDPVGYMFAEDLLIFADVQTLQRIIDGELPLVVSEGFAAIDSQMSLRPGLMYYVDLAEIWGQMLTVDPNVQPENDVMRLQALGSIGGTLTYDGAGLKATLVGTPGGSWLETIGAFVELLASL